VGTLTLDDAYARLIVTDAQGRLNLRDPGRPGRTAPLPRRPTRRLQRAAPLPVRVAIRQTRVNQGLVDFNDRFIKPSYSARGCPNCRARWAPSHRRTRHRAADAARPGDGQWPAGRHRESSLPRRWRWTWWPRPATSSSPMSPYAGKYVGYTRRRACPPLRYRRGDGQLNASNQIILNQLSFGDQVESPDATTLPVRFAVALLKDSRGVIDVDLPVSGSINDPEFSVGGIVWRLILNLIGKALTRPSRCSAGTMAARRSSASSRAAAR
jgi:hypothetical protein